ncbi:MAG: PKD domain-containing protein [Verrucomicrobiota bacterium]
MKGIILSIMLLLGKAGFAQFVVVDANATNLFAVGAAATNYSWSLDGAAVGGNSNSFSYSPQTYDVGTHYLLVNQTFPGAVNSNSYWAVRVRIPLPASGANYHVATNGADTNAGTPAAPFLTLEKARNAIRTNGVPAGGVTVWIHGGSYRRTNTFLLTAADSGRGGSPVVYAASPGETPIFTTGTPVDANSFSILDSNLWPRVTPGVTASNILQLDLTALGIANKGPLPTKYIRCPIVNPYQPGSDGGLCELFYHGQREPMSRYPDNNPTNRWLTPHMKMNGVISKTATNYLGTNYGGMFYYNANDESHIARWLAAAAETNLWIQGFWRVPWESEGLRVQLIDTNNNIIAMAAGATPGVTGFGNKYSGATGSTNEPYWALNLLEEINQTNEWSIDFARNKLYFLPPGPVTNGAVVISDFAAPVFQLNGCSNVVISGVSFDISLAQGIVITNGVNNLVQKCSFSNLGSFAVDLQNGFSNGVVSCDMNRLAAGGVCVTGGAETTPRVACGNYVVNNDITNFAQVVPVYAGGIDAGFGGMAGGGGGGGHQVCVGARVAHNHLSDTPHGPLIRGSYDKIVEYNRIENYCTVSGDFGGIYSYQTTNQGGFDFVRYNYLYCPTNYLYPTYLNPGPPGGIGIQVDNSWVEEQIYGNIATGRRGGFGAGITNPGSGGQFFNNFTVNIGIGSSTVGAINWNGTPDAYAANFAALGNTNITGGQTGPNPAYTNDPGFLNWTNRDLRLKPDSRIYTDLPTFQQIPFELIGLYNDEFRTNAGGYPPFIVTSSATAVTGTNAVFNGWLYFPQFESNTTVTVYYGPTDGGSNAGAWQSSANIGVLPAGPLSASLAGLPGGTNYFRFYAANAFGSSWSPATYSTVTPATVITSVTPGQTVLSNSVVNLSGQIIATGPLYPAIGETISVTINGSTQLGAVTNSTGYFWVAFNTAGLPAAGSPYVVNYYYGGNGSISSATNASTTLTIAPPSVLWSGTAGTNFEAGGPGGNWSDYAAPINDLIFSTAIFGSTPTGNQPSLTTSRSIKGLSFGATNGGWTLGSGSKSYFLSLGADGLSSLVQTNGTNVIGAGLNIAANQTWQAGTGGTLLFTGAITNAAAPVTNYSLALNAAGANGTVILSPGAGSFIKLTGTNGAPVLQFTNGGLLALGGDGVTAPATTSTNYVLNGSSGSGSLKVIGGASRVQVNSGIWNFGDFSRNAASEVLSGTLDVNAGGTISFAGARYIGGGTINVNGGTLRFANTNSLISNGAMFQLGYNSTGTATLNLSAGLVDVAVSATVGFVGSGIGAAQSAMLNQSGGILRNGLTPGSAANNISFSIGGLPYAVGMTNNRSAFTLAGGTLLSAGPVLGGTNAGPGSMNNFNFMGGVLAVQSFNATNLGSSPTATTYANQTNVSLALGTLANYGGALAPGNLGVPGKTVILGSYAVSNSAAVLAIDIGGTNQANAFQNGPTNYDFVAIAGSAALGGGLNINLINGFVPAATNSFIILTNGGTLSGSFTNLVAGRVAVTNLPGGSFEVAMNGAKVVLTNFGILQANFSASATNGATPLSVTFTDLSTGNITNRYWSFGDGAATNTMATSLAHTFASAGTNLVTLIVSDGLWTSTNSLALVAVGASGPPSIGGISWSGTQVIVAGTNGTAGERFYVLATTNLFLPMTNWDIIATNQSGPGGSINFTSPLSPGLPQLFYRLRRP